MRRRGSCRFAPYWKIQWWEERSLAWKDVQRSFASPQAARDAAMFEKGLIPSGAPARLMEVSEQGRKPLQLEEVPA